MARRRSPAAHTLVAPDEVQWIPWSSHGPLDIAVISDTHSQPHPRAIAVVKALAPTLIMHGGDIGQHTCLTGFAAIAPLIAVRGNIDGRCPEFPDVSRIHIVRGEDTRLKILLTHIAVYGPRLRAEVRRLAIACGSELVVCGHSHVPFLGLDGGIGLFNPGSIGPRRPPLPITLGHIRVSDAGVNFRHIDCETGQDWRPPGM